TPCKSPFNPDGTVNPTCQGFLAYTRSAPTRTLFPTDQARCQTSALHNFTLSVRRLYNGSNSSLANSNELFSALDTPDLRQSVETGNARVQRVNVNGDIAAVWQITSKISISDVYDFWYFRIPGINSFSTTSYEGTSMLQPPGVATVSSTADY